MIVNLTNPKGITLVRLPTPGGAFQAPFNPADVVPFVSAGVGDARQFRPDMTKSQNWAWNTTVPTAPLASGENAANHARKEPAVVTYEGMITDTPFADIGFGPLSGLPGVRRADALWTSLKAMWESRAFVAVIAPVAIFETALITNLALNRAPADGQAYYFSITVAAQRVFTLERISSLDDSASLLGAAATAGGGVVLY